MRRGLACCLVLAAAFAAAQTQRTFGGLITDSMCATTDHSRMQMGSNDAECTLACVNEHGATFVLFDGKKVYELSDQKTPVRFAGKKVVVTGTLDSGGRKILVASITAAK
jgi:hypothetical protein